MSKYTVRKAAETHRPAEAAEPGQATPEGRQAAIPAASLLPPKAFSSDRGNPNAPKQKLISPQGAAALEAEVQRRMQHTERTVPAQEPGPLRLVTFTAVAPSLKDAERLARIQARATELQQRTQTPEAIARRAAEAARDEARRLAQHLRASGIPTAYQNADFETDTHGRPLRLSPAAQQAHDLCRALAAQWKPGSRGLILYSQRCGTGKTHHGCAVLRALLHRNVSVRLFKAAEFLQLCRDSYSAKPGLNTLPTPSDVRGLYQRPAVLLIDELGGENIAGGDDGDWARERMLELVDWRTTNGKTILATTNLTPSQLQDHYGERTASRLLGHAYFVLMDGPDHRVLGAPTGDNPFA